MNVKCYFNNYFARVKESYKCSVKVKFLRQENIKYVKNTENMHEKDKNINIDIIKTCQNTVNI